MEDVDFEAPSLTIGRGLVDVGGKMSWSEGKNARSRRTIPLDASIAFALAEHKRDQAEERLDADDRWQDNDVVVATRLGRLVSPANFNATLGTIAKRAGLPPLSSHGLRHTAATLMVRHADDLGEVRAAADLLGHSPDMLMKTYAHALPESIRHRDEQDRTARAARNLAGPPAQ